MLQKFKVLPHGNVGVEFSDANSFLSRILKEFRAEMMNSEVQGKLKGTYFIFYVQRLAFELLKN